MFQHPWSEADKEQVFLFVTCSKSINNCRHCLFRVVEVEQFSYAVYHCFLKYLYTDEVDLPVDEALGKYWNFIFIISTNCHFFLFVDRFAGFSQRVLRDGIENAMSTFDPPKCRRWERCRALRNRIEIRGPGDKLQSTVTTENNLFGLIFYKTQDLEDYCLRFAVHHLTAVVQTEAFSKLDEATMKHLITRLATMGAFRY